MSTLLPFPGTRFRRKHNLCHFFYNFEIISQDKIITIILTFINSIHNHCRLVCHCGSKLPSFTRDIPDPFNIIIFAMQNSPTIVNTSYGKLRKKKRKGQTIGVMTFTIKFSTQLNTFKNSATWITSGISDHSLTVDNPKVKMLQS